MICHWLIYTVPLIVRPRLCVDLSKIPPLGKHTGIRGGARKLYRK